MIWDVGKRQRYKSENAKNPLFSVIDSFIHNDENIYVIYSVYLYTVSTCRAIYLS